MPTTSQRPKLQLTPEQLQTVRQLAQSRSAPHREVQRARMLCEYHAGRSFTEIAAVVRTTRRLVYECIDRALAMGPEVALRDLPHGKQEHTITAEDKAWVVHLACSKPTELGYAAELWTRRTLAEHIRKVAQTSGHPGLARAGKATVQRILDEQELKPHKIRYYLERRDPDFEAKLLDVVGLYLNPPDKALVLCVDERVRFKRWTEPSRCCPCGRGFLPASHTIIDGMAPPRCSPP